LSNKLSFLEQMEYLYVLKETKQLLNAKLSGEEDIKNKQLINDDLLKIDQEIEGITSQNNSLTSSEPIDFIFPYYEQDED
jgi:hypothetical protein